MKFTYTVSMVAPEMLVPLAQAGSRSRGVTYTGGGFGRFNPYGTEPDTETLQEKLDNLHRYADDVIQRVKG